MSLRRAVLLIATTVFIVSGSYFVAAIRPFDVVTNPRDRAMEGWCLAGLPAVDGEAYALIPASSREDAMAQLEAIMR